MKNVAKCDTWCELQNPVNHRVFERKLRPKPFGRGHACLGVNHLFVTPTSAPHKGARVLVTEVGLPWSRSAAGLKLSIGLVISEARGGCSFIPRDVAPEHLPQEAPRP